MRAAWAAFAILALSACGSPDPSDPPTVQPNTSAPYLAAEGPNVLPLEIGGTSLCGRYGYLNEPCLSVTVCVPGTSQCQTLTDILLDTGSTGLRVFSSVLSLTLPRATDGSGNTLAECAQFGTGSDWGPLATASVILGGEPPVTVPVQVIDKSFATAPTACAQADSAPKSTGFNGILGISPFNQDCGKLCEQDASLKMYYSCPSSGCVPIPAPADEQVANPVPLLPADNNGAIIALPQAGASGSPDLSGALVVGIDTQANNAGGGATAFSVDSAGNFTTVLSGKSYPGSFIDSGSNAFFFPNAPGLPVCPKTGSAPGFYCPASTQTLQATNVASNGSPLAVVPFQIGNAQSLLATGNSALGTIGGSASSSFDWGLPFFYGRAVVIGIEGRASSLGTGPLLAY